MAVVRAATVEAAVVTVDGIAIVTAIGIPRLQILTPRRKTTKRLT